MAPGTTEPKATLHLGDCIEVLSGLPPECVQACVTDPPAGISFMERDWDDDKGGRDEWIEWLTKVMREVYRVLVPGAHALVWALPRTSHWTGMALENAGFEIRDRISHIFGQGFPKNHNVSKALDRIAGAEREVVGVVAGMGKQNPEWNGTAAGRAENYFKPEYEATAPATPEAEQWDGWGTALKPSTEDWWLARKPFKGSVASNVLEWGTGAINIDGCRISLQGQPSPSAERRKSTPLINYKDGGRWPVRTSPETFSQERPSEQLGRWPAHFILSHHPECKQVGEDDWDCHPDCPVRQLGEQTQGQRCQNPSRTGTAFSHDGLFMPGQPDRQPLQHDDGGGASRFFLNLPPVDPDPFYYCPKANPKEKELGCDDRDEAICNDGRKTSIDNPYQRGDTMRKNVHPTVKPLKLMRYLCRLITPPGGTVLDPFMGSGSTGMGALQEGFSFLGIEQQEEFLDIARKRIAWALEQAPFEEKERTLQVVTQDEDGQEQAEVEVKEDRRPAQQLSFFK